MCGGLRSQLYRDEHSSMSRYLKIYCIHSTKWIENAVWKTEATLSRPTQTLLQDEDCYFKWQK